MKKTLLTLLVALVGTVAFSAIPQADARYERQFGYRADYAYSCNPHYSIRMYEFDATMRNRYNKLTSRCFRINTSMFSKYHRLRAGNYKYDQFGYDRNGVNMYGYDHNGRCRSYLCGVGNHYKRSPRVKTGYSRY